MRESYIPLSRCARYPGAPFKYVTRHPNMYSIKFRSGHAVTKADTIACDTNIGMAELLFPFGYGNKKGLL